jgi:hypothetical protein
MADEDDEEEEQILTRKKRSVKKGGRRALVDDEDESFNGGEEESKGDEFSEDESGFSSSVESEGPRVNKRKLPAPTRKIPASAPPAKKVAPTSDLKKR